MDCIEVNTLLPAVALFKEVRKVERGLFLDNSKDPLDRVAFLVVHEAHRPVFPHRAFQPHVKSDVPFE